MNKKFSLAQFLRKYNSDDACLEEIFNIKYPEGAYCESCKLITKFYKVKNRPVYQCSCGFQISPLAGTIFEKTTTPLQYWFYAMSVVTATRSGISAKQLQRELGVTYKTAWRMLKQIRILMGNTDQTPLKGIVEVDETFVGGKGKNRAHKWIGNETQKEILMGMLEREGKIRIAHIPSTGKWALLEQIQKNIDPSAQIMTDEFGGYIQLKKYGYAHEAVAHGKSEYTRGIAHTQNIEGFWGGLKRGIYGVYRHVSPKYLASYANEYGWRYNNRESGSMFDLLLTQIAAK